MFMLKKCSLFFILLLVGCSELATIGTKKHDFNSSPQKVVWIQLAGFSIEHLAMLRFHNVTSRDSSVLENMTCYGHMWNYDLYKLRPNDENNFLAQITGKQNIKNTCEDYEMTPIWKRFSNLGYRAAILENLKDERNSLTKALSCDGSKFLEGTYFWKMAKAPAASENFHYLEKKEYSPDKVYYDLSCQTKDCDSSLVNNFKSIYPKISQKESYLFFILRDFSYVEALRKKDFKKARETLADLSSMIDFLQKREGDDNLLIILTSAEPFSFEFPNSGEDWDLFERKGTKVLYRKSHLTSPVLARGASAENFCGVYEQWELHPRFLWRSQKTTRPILNLFDENLEITR